MLKITKKNIVNDLSSFIFFEGGMVYNKNPIFYVFNQTVHLYNWFSIYPTVYISILLSLCISNYTLNYRIYNCLYLGASSLIIAAENEQPDTVKFLLEHGAEYDVNFKDING